MAGYQRYLDLLAEIGAEPLQPKDYAGQIHYLWDRLGHYPRPTEQGILLDLAKATYGYIAQQRGDTVALVVAKARNLHISKNAGYAGAGNKDPWANFRLSSKFGVPPRLGVLVRMSDKYIRWQNLTRDPSNERVGESVLDTLEDFAAYALIAFCIGEERLLQ
jgi:hypothetical protein